MPTAQQRASNPQYWNEVQRKWRARNLEKARASALRWYHSHKNEPEKRAAFRASDRAKCAKRRGAPGDGYTPSDILVRHKRQRGRCAACRQKLQRYHVDHIYPLAKGGRNEAANIQLLCPPCNLSKGARDPLDFMRARGFLL